MTNDLLKLAPTMMSLGLLSDNLTYMNKKKKKSRDMVDQAIENIVGVSLIKHVSDSL